MISRITAEEATTILGLAGIAGAALAVLFSARIQASLRQFSAANDELRAEVKDHERRRAEDRERCDAELGKLRDEVADLRAQRQALTAEFGREIAGAIADEWTARRDSLAARVDALEQHHEDTDAGFRRDIARRRAHREGGQ